MSKKLIPIPDNIANKTAKEMEEDLLRLVACLVMKIIKQEGENSNLQDPQKKTHEDPYLTENL